MWQGMGPQGHVAPLPAATSHVGWPSTVTMDPASGEPINARRAGRSPSAPPDLSATRSEGASECSLDLRAAEGRGGGSWQWQLDGVEGTGATRMMGEKVARRNGGGGGCRRWRALRAARGSLTEVVNDRSGLEGSRSNAEQLREGGGEWGGGSGGDGRIYSFFIGAYLQLQDAVNGKNPAAN